MTRIGWLLIGLLVAVSAAGCAQRDWVRDTLTLADVTGTWSGTAGDRPVDATFRQSGSRVTGTSSEITDYGFTVGVVELEGVVNGEVLSFSGRGVSGEATVDGDEMTGRVSGPAVSGSFVHTCPSAGCRLYLRRQSSGRPGPQTQ